MDGVIYGYVFTIIETGEVVYVGIGNARRASDKSMSRNKKLNNLHKKHPCAKEIVFATSCLEAANAWEIATVAANHTWIDDPEATHHACNITSGGKACGKHSEETKKRMSDSLRGRKHSEESKKRMSDAKRGLKRSDEARKRMGDAQRLRYEDPAERAKASASAGRPKHCRLCGNAGHNAKTCSDSMKAAQSVMGKSRKNPEIQLGVKVSRVHFERLQIIKDNDDSLTTRSLVEDKIDELWQLPRLRVRHRRAKPTETADDSPLAALEIIASPRP